MSPLVWKGIVEFDYMTTAEEEEKYLTAEEISVLLLCKLEQITSPGMRITKRFGTLSTRRISWKILDFIHKEISISLEEWINMDICEFSSYTVLYLFSDYYLTLTHIFILPRTYFFSLNFFKDKIYKLFKSCTLNWRVVLS